MLLEGKPWRNNEIQQVVDEIEHLNKEYGIYRIRFRDPNFGFNRKYARELCEALIERGVKLEATVETSLEVFDEETLRVMYEAGIRTITTGIETNDEACMASIGQKIVVNDKLKQRIDFCHQIGFHIYGTYCLGMPEETWDTVRKTWMFARELDVESGFTVLTPFPGTPLYWRALREGYIPRRMQFEEWNSYTSTMHTDRLTTQDLDMARLWARLETILPYRGKRAAQRGALAQIGFWLRHVPHFLVRQYCRAYVWYRRSKEHTDAVSAGSAASARA
jgi:anaerobic magnesium-protoporphyrin IX monomethyl ester cyclase